MFRGFARFLMTATHGSDWNSVNNNAVFNIVGMGRKTLAGPRVDEIMSLTVPAVWAAVSRLSDMHLQCPIALYKRTDPQVRERVTDHPISDLLLEPNTPADLGMPDLIKQKELQRNLWGDAYWQIERSSSGQAVALWPLDTAVTTPLAGDGPFDRGVKAYRTIIGRTSVDLSPADVVHFKGLALDGFVSMSPIHSARQAIGLTLAMEKFGAEFFANEAKSGGFVMHPGKLTDVAKDNIRQGIEDQQKTGRGPNNSGNTPAQTGDKVSHRIKIFEEGMKWVPTTIAPNESQFLESREFQLSEVARLYNIPLVLLQSQKGSTVWGTGIEQLMLGFVNQTIRPPQVQARDQISRKLLTIEERQQGYEIDFDTSVLTVGDAMSRVDASIKAAGGPYISRNEARVAEGRNPLPGLDEILSPSNMVDPANPQPTPEPAAEPGRKPPNE